MIQTALNYSRVRLSTGDTTCAHSQAIVPSLIFRRLSKKFKNVLIKATEDGVA